MTIFRVPIIVSCGALTRITSHAVITIAVFIEVSSFPVEQILFKSGKNYLRKAKKHWHKTISVCKPWT